MVEKMLQTVEGAAQREAQAIEAINAVEDRKNNQGVRPQGRGRLDEQVRHHHELALRRPHGRGLLRQRRLIEGEPDGLQLGLEDTDCVSSVVR